MKSVRKRMAGLTAIIMSLLLVLPLVLEALPFAYAAAFGYEMKNVLSETPDERVFVYEFDKSAPNKMGKEAFLVAGPHGGSSEKKILTDGSMSSFSTTSITTETDNKDKRTVGWFVIDAGQTYPVSSVVLDLCHDWGAEDLVVQLSVEETFADPITIFNNDVDGSLGMGKPFSADPEMNENEARIMNVAQQGRTFSFAPVMARYIRVTGNTVGNGQTQGYTTLGEMKVNSPAYSMAPKTHSEVAPVTFSATGGTYSDFIDIALSTVYDDAVIYYTTDGSCPTENSAVYTGRLNLASLPNPCALRAVAKVDGIMGIPVDAVYEVTAESVSSNVAQGKTPYAKTLDMSEDLYFQSDTQKVTDGTFDTSSNYLVSKPDGGNADRTIGWMIIDFGAIYSIESVQVSFWHDNHFTYAAIQLSTSADFSTGVTTIYSNSEEIAAVTTTETEWANGNAQGKKFELETQAAARYIRVTGRRREDNNKYTMISEIAVNAADLQNVAWGKVAYAKTMDMSEDLNFARGNETITDGKFTTTTNYLTKGQPGEFIEADYTNGWTIIDFGAIYSIESVQVSLWHDNKFTHAAVQLSTSADFSTGVTTIYSNNDEIAPKTTDETAWANGNANGKTFKLETPVAARYIRVTGRRQPANSKYCMINEIVVNKALRAEIPAFGSYMVEAADQDGFEYERSLTAANGMTFDAILAKLPARLRLVDSNDQIGVYNGTWVCESYTKGDAGETREGDYHFRFVVEEGVENAPVDLYGVTDIVVTVAGVADVGDLQAAIAAAEAKTQTDYTASSYAAMTAVLTEAKALADRDVKSQAEVDAMEAKLTAAVQALIEKGDVTALKALCESLAGKKETDYTVSSWKPFAEAMAAAKALVDDPDDAGKEAIAAAKAKLEEAELAARGDVAALKGAYEANQRELGVDSADRRYTRQTWTDYLAAMADALAVVTDNSDSDQTAVDALLSALNASKAALVVRADTAEFAAVVAQYRAEEKQYSKASWEDFALVLRDTESALSGEDLSQEELDKVIAAFEEAAEKLVRLGDTARLNALIATEVDVSASTAKSVLAYVTALEQARLVANGISSETEVNAAYDALKNAIDGLEKRGDKTELSARLEEAKGYEVIGTPLAEAMNAARDVLDDADASEREVSAAYEALSAAMQNNKADDSCKSMLGAGSILASALALAAAVLLKKRFSVKK